MILYLKRTHYSRDPHALQIIAYFDELEVCNPLGSHVKKHKLRLVFFFLGNIHPKLRSSLKAINLVAVANSTVIDKYGMNKVLQPFVRDLNLLATHAELGIRILECMDKCPHNHFCVDIKIVCCHCL